MAEVLSQSQIDALLNSLQGGGNDDKPSKEAEQKEEKKYRKYDFYSPKKFTKDRLKILKSIFDNYTRIATSQINSLFRTSSEIEVIMVEEQRYYEYSNGLNDNDVLTLANVALPDNSKNPPMLLHTSQILMLSMIDRMLGGTGDDDIDDSSYTYTEIEMALYKRIVKYIIGPMKDAWSNYIKLDFSFDRLEENPSMFQEIGVDETIVIIMLEVTMRDTKGKINICMPGNLLMNIFTIMDKRRLTSMGDEDSDKDNKQEIMNNIKVSTLEIAAKLGEVEISLEDVYNLHVGDVVNLGQPKDSDVALYVEGQPWFMGQLGVHKRNVAVQIESRIREEEDVEESEEKAASAS